MGNSKSKALLIVDCRLLVQSQKPISISRFLFPIHLNKGKAFASAPPLLAIISFSWNLSMDQALFPASATGQVRSGHC